MFSTYQSHHQGKIDHLLNASFMYLSDFQREWGSIVVFLGLQ